MAMDLSRSIETDLSHKHREGAERGLEQYRTLFKGILSTLQASVEDSGPGRPEFKRPDFIASLKSEMIFVEEALTELDDVNDHDDFTRWAEERLMPILNLMARAFNLLTRCLRRDDYEYYAEHVPLWAESAAYRDKTPYRENVLALRNVLYTTLYDQLNIVCRAAGLFGIQRVTPHETRFDERLHERVHAIAPLGSDQPLLEGDFIQEVRGVGLIDLSSNEVLIRTRVVTSSRATESRNAGWEFPELPPLNMDAPLFTDFSTGSEELTLEPTDDDVDEVLETTAAKAKPVFEIVVMPPDPDMLKRSNRAVERLGKDRIAQILAQVTKTLTPRLETGVLAAALEEIEAIATSFVNRVMEDVKALALSHPQTMDSLTLWLEEIVDHFQTDGSLIRLRNYHSKIGLSSGVLPHPENAAQYPDAYKRLLQSLLTIEEFRHGLQLILATAVSRLQKDDEIGDVERYQLSQGLDATRRLSDEIDPWLNGPQRYLPHSNQRHMSGANSRPWRGYTLGTLWGLTQHLLFRLKIIEGGDDGRLPLDRVIGLRLFNSYGGGLEMSDQDEGSVDLTLTNSTGVDGVSARETSQKVQRFLKCRAIQRFSADVERAFAVLYTQEDVSPARIYRLKAFLEGPFGQEARTLLNQVATDRLTTSPVKWSVLRRSLELLTGVLGGVEGFYFDPAFSELHGKLTKRIDDLRLKAVNPDTRRYSQLPHIHSEDTLYRDIRGFQRVEVLLGLRPEH